MVAFAKPGYQTHMPGAIINTSGYQKASYRCVSGMYRDNPCTCERSLEASKLLARPKSGFVPCKIFLAKPMHIFLASSGTKFECAERVRLRLDNYPLPAQWQSHRNAFSDGLHTCLTIRRRLCRLVDLYIFIWIIMGNH